MKLQCYLALIGVVSLFGTVILTLSRTHGKLLGDVSSEWLPWSRWSTCTERVCCHHGVRIRRRSCSKIFCTGIESESDDCPTRNCKECPSVKLAESSIAATSSFINMQCDTNTKYSVSGKFSFLVHPSLYEHYPSLKKVLRPGFFGRKKVHLRMRGKNKIEIFKYCFEPKYPLTPKQAGKIFRTNRRFEISRTMKDSLVEDVNGFVVTLHSNGDLFRPGIYYASARRNSFKAYYYYEIRRK